MSLTLNFSNADEARTSGSAAPRQKQRAETRGAAIWSVFQGVSFKLLLIGAVLTILLIVLSTLPHLIATRAGSAIIPGWQLFNHAILVLHILTAIPPLLIGFFEFSTAARRASPKWHRWLGTAYCVCIWISAVTGLALAVSNTHGIVAQTGFSLLAIVWFTTTWQAYTTARAKDFVSHRRWMIRSFAVTLAVVSIRPMFIFAPMTGLPHEVWYPALTWLCWVPNLLIGELYLRATMFTGRLSALRPRRARTAS